MVYSNGTRLLLLVIACILFAAEGLMQAPAQAASDRTQPSARAMVEEQGQKARLVVYMRDLPYRGRTRVAHASIRAADRKLWLKKESGNRWASIWRPAPGVTSLRGKRASVKVKRRTIRRSIHLKLTIANGGGHNIPIVPVPPDPVPPEPDPIDPVPPDPVPPDPDPPPDPVPTEITVPGLLPSWSEDFTDFTVGCQEPVEFSVVSSDPVSIDGSESRNGQFSDSVTLLPGQSTSIKVGGSTQTVRCRPEDLPLPAVDGHGEGLYLTAPTVSFGEKIANYAMVINADGVPIWWYDDPDGRLFDFKLIDGETLAWTRAGPWGFVIQPNHYDLRKFDGTVAGTVGLVGHDVGTDQHDLQPTPDGGWLILGYQPRGCPAIPADCEDLSPWGGPSEANVIDAVVQKVNADNQLVWEWTSRGRIGLEESAAWISWLGSGTPLPGGNSLDIIHMNSVEPSGDGFVFSARHLNAVYRVTDPSGSGQIDWKLGGTDTPESLSVSGDTQGSQVFGGQHDARMLADGTLTLHDNGSGWDRPPRMVRYSIAGGSATLLESISEPQVTNSTCCGSARRLPDGNWLASWGASDQVVEYDPAGNPVFRLTWPGGLTSYRATRESPERLNPADLRAGMEAQYPRQVQPGG